eukprot:258637_1
MGLPSSCRSWLIGVSLAIIANIVSNLGLNFQKKAHSIREKSEKQRESMTDTEEIEVTQFLMSSKSPSKSVDTDKSISISDPCIGDRTPSMSSLVPHPRSPKQMKQAVHVEPYPSSDKSYICDLIWLSGLCMQVFGAILDFLALGFAPQSVVAPLGSLTLVVNVFLSPCMHNQKPSFQILLFTTIIIVGAATTVASSPRTDKVDSIVAVFNLYRNMSFFTYALGTGTFIVVGWIATQYLVTLSVNKPIEYERSYYKYHRFFIASIAGTMGAQNILFAKSISTLIVQSTQHGSMMLLCTYFQTYLLLLGLLLTIFFQLRWLNDGLQRFSALYVAPTFQAFWITVSVLGGLVVFDEFETMGATQKMIFSSGVLMTVIGVLCLTQQGKPKLLRNGQITIRHYIPLVVCVLVLYFIGSIFLHSKYSLCR